MVFLCPRTGCRPPAHRCCRIPCISRRPSSGRCSSCRTPPSSLSTRLYTLTLRSSTSANPLSMVMPQGRIVKNCRRCCRHRKPALKECKTRHFCHIFSFYALYRGLALACIGHASELSDPCSTHARPIFDPRSAYCRVEALFPWSSPFFRAVFFYRRWRPI